MPSAWSIRTSTINEGGSDVAWDDLQAIVPLQMLLPDKEIAIEVGESRQMR